MRRFLFVLAPALMFACTNVQSGTIVKKDYTAPWTQYVQTCVSYNKSGGCMFYTFVPQEWPAEYNLKLQDDNGDTGWVSVAPQDYSKVRVGDQYP
jgi:hypothetical protein